MLQENGLNGDEEPAPAIGERSLPEPGTRVRKFVIKDVNGKNGFMHSFPFDHFNICISYGENSRRDSVRYVNIESYNSMVGDSYLLPEFLPPWSVHFQLKVVNSNGQEILKDNFCLNNQKGDLVLDVSRLLEIVFDVHIEFYQISGLGVKPLRDYSVPNDLSNVVLLVENKQFHLNKGFLAGLSPFFERLFFGDFAEKNQKEVTLKDVAASVFTELLDVVHHEVHHLYSKEMLLSVLSLADQFNMETILSKLQTTMLLYGNTVDISPGDQLWIADKYRMKTLLNHSIHDWCEEFACHLSEEMFKQLSHETRWAIFRRWQ